MIRPPVAGAVPVKVDESSLKDIPGAKVVLRTRASWPWSAEKEWDAIRAAQALKVEWSDAKPPFPDQKALYDYIRNAPVRKREVDGKSQSGDVDEAFKAAARVIEAEYEWPFQSHACMGPACAVVEIKDGEATVWTGSQKPHYVRDGVAATLEMPPEKVRAIWVTGPGCYGRNDAERRSHGCRRHREGDGPSGARAIHTRAGHRLGSERSGLGAQGARGDRRFRQSHCL